VKIKTLFVLLAIIISVTGCATIFNDNFEADVVGNPPSASPAGDPPDDSLNVQGAANSIVVINSIPLGSMAVKIDRTAQMPQSVLECVTGGGPHASGNYFISYTAYSVNVDAVPSLTTTIKSSGGQRAFQLILTGGNYQLSSGDGMEILPGGYAANVVHSVLIRIDMDARRFWLNINGTDVASEKPFLDAGFADVHLLRFEYPAPVLEALPGTYVVDDIVIRK
jgi:hypothetical protein